MPLSLPINNQRFQSGDTIVGPASIAAGDSGIRLEIDRNTGNAALNTRNEDTTVMLLLYIDRADGKGFKPLGTGGPVTGGFIPDETGAPMPTAYVQLSLIDMPNPNRRIQGIVRVVNGPVTLGGALTVD